MRSYIIQWGAVCLGIYQEEETGEKMEEDLEKGGEKRHEDLGKDGE